MATGKGTSRRAATPSASMKAAPSDAARLRLEGTRAKGATATAAPGGGGPLPTLRILETRILRGANYWSRQPVVRMVVDLGVLEGYPSNTIPGFVEALLDWMPSVGEHACSLNRRGG